jgi:D-alanyl-D-alanine carboxypeptidase
MLRQALGVITIGTIVIATFCFGLFLVAVWSVNDALFYQPELQVGMITASVSGPGPRAYMVFDVESGTEIVSKNSTEILPIASVTKLVTASMFYADTDLSATTSVTWSDVNTQGDAGRLHAQDEYTHRELLFPLLLESSNDAASAMLRVKPDLLQKMDAYAKELGLATVSFEDPSGLSPNNKASAYELSKLARALYHDNPHIFDITRLKQYIGVNTGWMNNNPLVREEGYVGGKHGFTYEANRTAVAFFNEPLASGQTRVIGYVVLGSDNVLHDIQQLRPLVQANVWLE